jgi:hypothetical protein
VPISLYLHIDKLAAKPDQAISFDLDHVVHRFHSLGRHDFDYMADLITKVAGWLQRRLRAARMLDEGSRDFPTVRFYNEAVAARVDDIQRGALAPPPSFAEQMARAGRAFVHGVGRIAESVHESLVIPRFLDTLAELLQGVLKSIDRFMVPTADLFDPSKRTASDLFGELALGLRIALTSRGQIAAFLNQQLAPALNRLRGKSDGGPTIAPLDTPQALDQLARYVLGGIMVLGVLPELVASIWKSVSISVREQMIRRGAATEARVYELRRQVIDFFYVDLFEIVKKASSYAGAAGEVFWNLLAYTDKFLRLFVTMLLRDFHRIVERVVDFVEAVAHWVIDKFAPQVSHLGLLLFALNRIVQDLIDTLDGLLTFVDALDLSGLSERLDRLRDVSRFLLSRPTERLVETALIAPPDSFPNIGSTLFGSARLSALRAKLQGMAGDVSDNIRDALDSGSRALWRESELFDQASDVAARRGPSIPIEQIAARATAQATGVFGEEMTQLRRDVANKGKDQLAERFESWLALGGFELIGQVVPQYIGAMLAEWRRQEVEGTELTTLLKVDDQTSPHILAARAALGTARIKKITVNAQRRELDDKLIAEIASAFQSAIAGAFTSGTDAIHKHATAAATKKGS